MNPIVLRPAGRADDLGVVLLHFVKKLGESATAVWAEDIEITSSCVFPVCTGHKAILD